MSRWLRLLLSFTSFLTAWIAVDGARPAAAQGIPVGWRQLEGPGGRVTQLAAAPGDKLLYAVAVTGVNRQDDHTQWFDTGRAQLAEALYRSTNGGLTWAAATNDLPPGQITDLFVEPQTGDLLAGFVGRGAGADRAGLWRYTAESGWWQVDLGGRPLIVRSIARSADGRVLMAGALESGETPGSYMARSSDGGRTWELTRVLPDGLPPDGALSTIWAHPSDPQRFFFASQNGALLATTDGGAAWLPVAPREAMNGPALLAVRPDRAEVALLARNTETGVAVARSSDGGLSWQRVDASGLPPAAQARSLAALNSGVYLISTDRGAYHSSNDGMTWQALEGALSSGGVSEFLVLPAGTGRTTVFAATGYGMFISRDSGAIWQAQGSRLPQNSKIRGLLTHAQRPGQILALSDNRLNWGAATPPPVLLSIDGGKRWLPAAGGLPEGQFNAWVADPTNADRMWVTSSEAVYRTTDAGLTWQKTPVPSSARNGLAISADGAVLFVAGNPPMRSTNGGDRWTIAPVRTADGTVVQTVTGFALDPRNARHVWAASEGGILESRDRGETWTAAGLEAKTVRWVAATGGIAGGGAPLRMFAGVAAEGVYRRTGDGAWEAASAGLPAGSTVLAFAAAPNGAFWLTRDGGGVYRSSDGGASWQNAGNGLGDNLGQALAPEYGEGGEVLLGTANAGIWAAGGSAAAPAASPTPVAGEETGRPGPGVDARIEVVWPHNFSPVQEARLANIGIRLFVPGSLRPPACGWRPRVTLWQASATNPAAPLKEAQQRTVDGQPFPYWDVNDVDVSAANDPNQKLYFIVKVEEIETATSVWAHAADARTYFPVQDAPSGMAAARIDEVDARIQIVWPHDESGNEQPVGEATLANVVVAFFKHGTRLSVPPGWQPSGITLQGAWNQEIGRVLSAEAVRQMRQSGAIVYPVWEFNNIPVERARDGTSRLYLWANAAGVTTYPTIWAHGSDSRTFFPEQDEPIQGCAP